MYQCRQSCLLPGRIYLGIPQSPSSLVLALHPRCFWVWDQQKCFKRYPLSIKNSFLAFQERKNGYRALFQEKGEKNQGQPFLQGAKMMSLKKYTEFVLFKIRLVNMWILFQCMPINKLLLIIAGSKCLLNYSLSTKHVSQILG